MKRLGSSDSLGAFMSMCPPPDEESPRGKQMYRGEYQSMLEAGLEEEGCGDEGGHIPEKKRRLSVDQVKALERSFEVENKLEPERKVKLAHELGLQPRQVAVWFQNRRARWKTKQLEKDYGVLKASFDALKHSYDSLLTDKDALLNQIKLLRGKLDEENPESNPSIKEEEEVILSDNENNKGVIEEMNPSGGGGSEEGSLVKGGNASAATAAAAALFPEFKDGPSDSDSSAILNDDRSPNASNSSSGVLQSGQMLMSPGPSSFRFQSPSPSSIPCFGFSDSRSDGLGGAQNSNVYHPQFVKMEEHNFFGGEEACNFFSEDQAPSLHWYCPEQWT